MATAHQNDPPLPRAYSGPCGPTFVSTGSVFTIARIHNRNIISVMESSDPNVTLLSGAEKAAAVLLAMGETVASEVLRHMDERTLEKVSATMAKLRTINVATAANAVNQLSIELDATGLITSYGFSHVRRLLVAALGEEKATALIERIMRSGEVAADVLSRGDPKLLADQFGHERPQLLAVLLGYMSRLSAVSFLTGLSEQQAANVVYRYARMDTLTPEAMAELRGLLSETLGNHDDARPPSIGGIRGAADLLNAMGVTAAERALANIQEKDAPTADRIRENMFTFEDLSRLDDMTLQTILRSVAPERLAPALRAASPQIRARVLDNVSKKAAEYLREEIETGPRVTRREAHAAQRAIIEAATGLAQKGTISLAGGEDML